MRYFHLPGPKKKGTKWYSVHLQPDLFGDTHLICRWGRVGRAKVSQSIDRYDCAAEATSQLELVTLGRLEAGYTQVKRSEIERHLQVRPGQQLLLLTA